MTYRGIIRQGVVVLDDPGKLADGTRVQVEVLHESRSDARRAFHPVGVWDGPPGELDRLLAEVQELRDADLKLEKGEGR